MTELSRKNLFHRLFILALLASPWHRSAAQPLVLKGGEYRAETHPHCKVWMDGSRQASFPEAMRRWRNGEFRPLDSLELPSKFSRGAYNYWVLLEVENTSLDTFPLVLFAHRLSDDSIWQFSNNGPPSVKLIPATMKAPIDKRLIAPISWTGVWDIGPGERDTLLIKYYNFKPVERFLPRVSDARGFSGRHLNEHLLRNWVFLFGFGAAFSVLLYSFSVWVGTRDPAFGWYAAYCAVIAYISWWDAEENIAPLRFFLGYFEWAYTKTLVHTLLLGICYAQFIRHFFRDRPPLLKQVLRWFVHCCAAAAVVELVLLQISLHWSWVFYFWLRSGICAAALVFLYFIWKIPGLQSRLILLGMLTLSMAELLSNFALPAYTSHVAVVGVLLDLFFFTIALAVRNQEDFREKAEMQMAAQRTVFEQEREKERLRTRIAQDIHDEVGGSLTKISLAAQVASRLPDLSKVELKSRMEKLGADARHAAGHLREIVFSINPDFDRFEEMQAYFQESAREFWSGTSVTPHFDFGKNGHNPLVPPNTKRQLLLIFKEAQNNMAKHAGAKNAWLTLRLEAPDRYHLEVRDDGQGFDVQHQNGFTQGLSGMRKRAESIGAALSVRSSLGEGTMVQVIGKI